MGKCNGNYKIAHFCLTAQSRRYQRKRQYRLNSKIRVTYIHGSIQTGSDAQRDFVFRKRRRLTADIVNHSPGALPWFVRQRFVRKDHPRPKEAQHSHAGHSARGPVGGSEDTLTDNSSQMDQLTIWNCAAIQPEGRIERCITATTYSC